MPTLLFWQFLGSVDSRATEGSVRSGFHDNCQPPIPLQLNTLFHHHGSSEAPVSRGTGGDAGGNVRWQEGGSEGMRQAEGKQVL